MIDYFKGKIEINPPQEIRNQQYNFISFLGLTFRPDLLNNSEITYYKARLENLKLTIIGSTLYLENSLWKYYHGNNYKPFTYLELVSSIVKLEEHLQLNLSNLEIIKLEYGVVLNTDNINLTFNDFGKYKLLFPSNMTKDGRRYGIYYQNTTHKIKIYDKKFEAKREGHQVPNELLRLEKRCYLKSLNKTKNFNGITAYYLGDFKKEKIVKALFKDLIDSVKNIEIIDIDFLLELNPKEIRILSYMDDTEYLEVMKKEHLSTFKRDKLLFDKIKKNSTNKKYYDFLKILEEQKKVIF